MVGLIAVISGIVQLIVGLRFFFLLLGANPNNSLVMWIYNTSSPLVRPFEGIFGQSSSTLLSGTATPSVIDWSALIALLVYGVVTYLISRIATSMYHRPFYR